MRCNLCDNSHMREDTSYEARRQRAELRRSMPGEVVRTGANKPSLYASLSPLERFAQMSQLCVAQWEASGRVITHVARHQWPGKIFRIEHE